MLGAILSLVLILAPLQPAPPQTPAPLPPLLAGPIIETQLRDYIAGVVAQEALDAYIADVVAQEAETARVAQEAAQRRSAPVAAPRTQTSTWGSSMEPCGGSLPPCYVKARESGGDYNAQNPTSSASGAWQFLDSTWGGYGGYSRAVYAPPAVQDERARQLWAGGAGCSHWAAC